MSEETVVPDPAGRIPPGAVVGVTRRDRRETGEVVDNQGPAYLIRFGDGAEDWFSRAGVEHDNPTAGEWPVGEERAR